MKRDTFLSILLTAFLAVLGWLCVQTADLKADVAAIKERLNIKTVQTIQPTKPQNEQLAQNEH